MRVLAVASGGGHWSQLMRIKPAFEGCEMIYASTIADHADLVPTDQFLTIPDASRWERIRAARCALRVGWLFVRWRPDAVVSTGALPGFFAVAIGKTLFRCRTIWIDSVANAEELSLAGRRAGRFADIWLTQWEHLATKDGPHFSGSVLG